MKKILLFILLFKFLYSYEFNPYYTGTDKTVLAEDIICFYNDEGADKWSWKEQIDPFFASHRLVSWISSTETNSIHGCFKYRISVCDKEDERYEIPDGTEMVEDIHYDCGASPAEVQKQTDACQAVSGYFFKIATIHCCFIAQCVVKSTCKDGEELDSRGECVPACPEYSSRDLGDGSCRCSYGYDMEKDTCLPPKCPTSDTRFTPALSLYKTVSKCTECTPDTNYDYSCLGNDDIACCYGNKDDSNGSKTPVCADDEVLVDDKCYKKDGSDSDESNSTSPSEEDGDTGSSSSEDGSAVSDDNSSKTPTEDEKAPVGDDTNDTGDKSSEGEDGTDGKDTEPSKGKFEDALSPFLDTGKGVIDSYVLVDIPVTITGGDCSGSLRQTIKVFGNSYTIDLSEYMPDIDKDFSWLKPLVIFMFGFSAVVIVLSNKD